MHASLGLYPMHTARFRELRLCRPCERGGRPSSLWTVPLEPSMSSFLGSQKYFILPESIVFGPSSASLSRWNGREKSRDTAQSLRHAIASRGKSDSPLSRHSTTVRPSTAANVYVWGLELEFRVQEACRNKDYDLQTNEVK